MYQPIEQELLEMGFEKVDYRTYWRTKISEKVAIMYNNSNGYGKVLNDFHLTHDDGEYLNTIKFYPTSKSDIETLIRLFSKP